MLNHKNICLIMPTFFYANPRSIRIAKALTQKGFYLDIICFNDSSVNPMDYIFMEKVTVHTMKLERKKSGELRYFYEYFLFSIFSFIKLFKLFLKKKFWAIHVNNPPDTLVFITIFHKLFFNVKIILDISEPLSKSYSKKFKNQNSIFLTILDKIQLLSCCYADKIITVSEAFKRELLRIGVQNKKIYILFNSPDTTFYTSKLLNTSKKDLAIEEKRFVILYQGVVSSERGIDILVDAVSYLKTKIPSVLGIIVGGGNQLSLIKQRVKQEKLENYFIITGKVAPQIVPKYVAIADVCLLMALKIPVYELYSPDKLFEYMVYKKIIIAPHLQGIVDITAENGCVFYEPGNAKSLSEKILEVYESTDADKLKHIHLLQQIYQRYKWDIAKLEMYKCYDELKNTKEK